MKTPRLLLAARMLSSLAWAKAHEHKPAPGVTVITAGQLLDLKPGKTLNDIRGVIEGGKIVRAGEGAKAAREALMNDGTHTGSGWITRAEEVPPRPIASPITFDLKYVGYPHLKRMDYAPPDWLVELRRMRGRVLYDECVRPCFRTSECSFDDPDPADLFAYHILARTEQSIVACARVVPSGSIHSGFIASALGLQKFWTVVDMVRTNREQVCEASRWVVVPEFRGVLGRQIVAASGAVMRWLSIRLAFVLAATCRKQDVALIRMGARPINGLPLIASPFSKEQCRLLYFDLLHLSPWMEKQIIEMTGALRLGCPVCPVHW